MISIRRYFHRGCLIPGCGSPVVATWGANDDQAACDGHFEGAIRSLGLPTVVLDWSGVDPALFDAASLTALFEGAIAASESWSLDESAAGAISGVLSEVLHLTPSEEWPTPVPGIFAPSSGPKPANALWHQCIQSDPLDPRSLVNVPLTKQMNGLPVALLSDVSRRLESPRAKAFLDDVLWCATGERSFALEAIRSHSLCAIDEQIALRHDAIPQTLANVEPDHRAKDVRRRTWMFRLAHLRRAVRLAQTFNETELLQSLFDSAESLLLVVDHEERTVFDLLFAVATSFSSVPAWWDSVAETETERVEQLTNAPISVRLDDFFELLVARARAQQNSSQTGKLRERQVRCYWSAADRSTADGLLKGEWLRRAHELAERHATHSVFEARQRY